MFSRDPVQVEGYDQRDLPGLIEDLRRYVGGRAADGIQRAGHHGSQAEVSQLQRAAAVQVLVHLEAEGTGGRVPSFIINQRN